MRITLTGMSLGAGLMYLFDPLQGRRRRALLRDRVTRIVNSSEDFLDKASRDLNNRITGMTSELESLLSREVPTDRTLVERVRSKMGRYVSHPGAIEVTADQGRVVRASSCRRRPPRRAPTSAARVDGDGIESCRPPQEPYVFRM